MSLPLSSLSHDPVLREQVERRRIAEKREKAAAELRAGPSPMDSLEADAAEWLKEHDARRPTTSPANDVDVDTSDLDPELVGAAGIADAHSTRLREGIEAGMVGKGYADLLARVGPELRTALIDREPDDSPHRRRARDRARVSAELGQPKYEKPARAEAKPVLTGTSLIEQAAAEDLPRLLAQKRTRRR